MHFSLILSLFTAVLLTTGCSNETADASIPAAEENTWTAVSDSVALKWQSLDVALEEARLSGKKILIDVYAPWCGWCRKLQTEVQPHPDVASYISNTFILARVNGEDTENTIEINGYTVTGRELAIALGMQGYPTTVYLGADGSPITRIPGFLPTEDYLTVARFIGSEAYLAESFEDYRKRNNP